MSDIQAGDLVEIIGAGCEHTKKEIGMVFSVLGIYSGSVQCAACGKITYNIIAGEIAMNGRHAWKPLSWLRKINPPAVQQTTDEEITA